MRRKAKDQPSREVLFPAEKVVKPSKMVKTTRSGQALVNAQVEVNRAVFEYNRPNLAGPLQTDIDLYYLRVCAEEGIKELQKAISIINEELDFLTRNSKRP